jgi:histidinol-phosphate/aromatic aminotransferase/cobyric acid decarboxylase-like protein
MNIMNQGLNVQALQVKANKQALTNKDVNKLHQANLVLVNKPDAPKTNVFSLEDRRVMAAHTSPEAA